MFVVLDFGSQLTQVIARRLRELEVFSVLLPFDASLEKIQSYKPEGIILSGGPSSVRDSDAPLRDVSELMNLAPVLGICYGMQLLTQSLGGKVGPADEKEYGFNIVRWNEALTPQVPLEQKVWMSHGDVVLQAPKNFKVIAYSESKHPAAMRSERAWGLQFHPEVAHTEHGKDLLKAFVFDFCKARAEWKPKSIVDNLLEKIRQQVPKGEMVLCALSGGVDSTVTATLLTKALGKESVQSAFVDHGLLRKNEFDQVLARYEKFGLNVKGINAKAEFMSALSGVEDPEKKRKIIGGKFIEIFDSFKKSMPVQPKWLAQGTLYPDVIESVSPRGASVTIKTHHNVGGLPEKMHLKLVEPLRELFKDEVRKIGEELGIAKELLGRHPFPGPGLAIRIIGAVDADKIRIVQDADAIFIDEMVKAGLYDKIWQAFCVLLPVNTVGVQGDGRTYERVLALRAITSSDGMTADWYPFEFDFLRRVSNRITNEVRGVNRVVYDVTSKPPGTIEWE